MEIEFVSYDGEYPCLCHGELVLKLDGVECHFHYKYFDQKDDAPPNCYPDFWSSGGSTGFTSDMSDSYVKHGEWELNPWYNNFPSFISDNFEQIMKVFNENVPYGCCGGCL